MTHYEKRLEADLERIRDRIRAVSRIVETAVRDAVRAVLTTDKELAARIVLGDLRVNRMTREIDRLCHAFVARHFPSAGHLRFISSVLRLDIALERIGDYAVTISREAVQLSAPPPKAVARDIEILAEQARKLLSQALQSFDEGNTELARGTLGMASHVRGLFDKIFDDLTREGEERNRPIRDVLELMLVFIRLERIRAQAKNICEETIFTTTGEMKGPKTYRVLFVDRDNGPASQIAEAYAAKAFGDRARFASAGYEPADRVDPRLADFLDRHGLALGSAEPRSLADYLADLGDFHVIVALDPDVDRRIERLPFHTTLIHWPAPAVEDLGDEALEAAYKDLAPRVRELMDTLLGLSD